MMHIYELDPSKHCFLYIDELNNQFIIRHENSQQIFELSLSFDAALTLSKKIRNMLCAKESRGILKKYE